MEQKLFSKRLLFLVPNSLMSFLRLRSFVISDQAINREHNEKKAKYDKGEGRGYLIILIRSECESDI